MAQTAQENTQVKVRCPDVVLQAIYGTTADKKAAYDQSLNRWWKEYADRKADEEDEHVADSLLYDRNHLPRAAPPPDSVFEERARLKVLPNGSTIVSQQTVKETIIS